MTVVNLQVAASADDTRATFNDAFFDSTSSSLNIYSSATDSGRNALGARFTGGPPQGATISAATMQLWVGSIGGFNDMDALIYGEAADAAVNYTTSATLWGTRVKTTATVNWSATGLTASAFATSPELKTIIQEIVNRASYAGTINMMLFGGTATERFLEGDAYDRSTAHAAKLDITYTTASNHGKNLVDAGLVDTGLVDVGLVS